MKHIITSVLCVCLFLWTSCSKEDELKKEPVINVSVNELTVAATAENGSLDLTVQNATPEGKLTVQTEHEWISNFEFDGSQLKFRLTTNIGDERKAFLVISYPEAKDAVVTIKQMSASESIELSKDNAEVGHEGGTASALVTSGRKWTLEGSYEWVHPTSLEGLPNTEVSFKIDPNIKLESRKAEFFIVCGKNKAQFTISQNGAPLNSTITDENFKNYLLKNFDTDGNGEITQDEANAIEYINYVEDSAVSEDGSVSEDNNGIASFNGVEYLVNLKKFSFTTSASQGGSKSTVETIDLSKNKKLEEVAILCQSVKTVNLEGLGSLKTINTGACTKLEKLNITDSPELLGIYSYNNSLTEINLSSCTKLQTITIYGNKLQSLDLSSLTNLEQVSVGMETLENIVLPPNPKITSLSLDNSKIKDLNVSSLTELTDFSYQYCRIENIALTSSPKLEKLDLYMHQNLKTIDISKNLKLRDMDISSKHDEYGDCLRYLKKITLSEDQEVLNMRPSMEDIKSGKWYNAYYENVEVVYINDPNFNVLDKITDAKLKQEVLIYDSDSDGKITKDEAANVTEMNLKSKGLTSLEGLQWFTGLVKLDASENDITYVDMSKWKSLKEVNLSHNKLRTINHEVCLSLVSIDFSYNELTEIVTTSSFNALETVNFSHNKLSSVKITYNDNVKHIDVSYNELENAEIGGRENKSIEYLDISNNKFTVKGYDNPLSLWGLKGLKTLKADNFGHFAWKWYQDLSGLSLETLILTGDDAIDFVKLDITGSAATLKKLDISGCTNLKDVYIGDGAVIQDSDIIKEAGTTIHRTALPK